MKRIRRILLLCNGEAPSRALVRALARQADRIIAADGGANTARACGIRPDVIIGDLDSIRPSTRRHFKDVDILRDRRQDNTDFEKALDFLVADGGGDVAVVGAIGGRLDFTLGNLSVIWNYTSQLTITFRGDGWYARPVGSAISVNASHGTTVSLIPFGHCDGVTLRGLKYPLHNARLHVGQTGLSNVVRSSPCTVKVRRGNLLLVVLDTRAPKSRSRSW